MVGMTPKTVRLPKKGEALLSINGSPLGVFDKDKILAIPGESFVFVLCLGMIASSQEFGGVSNVIHGRGSSNKGKEVTCISSVQHIGTKAFLDDQLIIITF